MLELLLEFGNRSRIEAAEDQALPDQHHRLQLWPRNSGCASAGAYLLAGVLGSLLGNFRSNLLCLIQAKLGREKLPSHDSTGSDAELRSKFDFMFIANQFYRLVNGF
jgi:hypothetical protein